MSDHQECFFSIINFKSGPVKCFRWHFHSFLSNLSTPKSMSRKFISAFVHSQILSAFLLNRIYCSDSLKWEFPQRKLKSRPEFESFGRYRRRFYTELFCKWWKRRSILWQQSAIAYPESLGPTFLRLICICYRSRGSRKYC